MNGLYLPIGGSVERLSIILIFLLGFTSCVKKEPQEIREAIDEAQTFLSSGKCDAAIDVLEDVGRQTDDPIYLQVLASAYTCRAGFSEITFIDADLDRIETTTTDFMGSLTTLSSSQETVTESLRYQDLRQAINILLNVDENQPSQVNRNAIFGNRKASDMAIQTIFLSLAQLGKFLKVYGNVDTNGAKGAGAGPNQCFIGYTYVQAQSYLNGTGNGGACDNIANDVGHPDLSLSTANLATTRRRMCEGLMLVTNILDIMNSVNLPVNSSVDKLEDVIATVNEFKDFVVNTSPALETLLETTSQQTCETLTSSASEFDNLQFVYALLFERGLP